MKIVSIVGARPEFVQVAVLSRVLRRRHTELLVHTGQHYDERMSERFFTDLGIPEPDVNLGVAAASPSAQTGEMLGGLADALRRARPDLVIVRGDTNSTLAGSLAAKQLLLPLAHVEGGMRSYDRTMPEEINRIVSDHIADIALVTDDAARRRLAGEGITTNVHVCGDVMYDVFLQVRVRARAQREPRLRALQQQPYDLLTVHRAENTDDPARLRAIMAAFTDAPRRIIFPVHPRTAARLAEFGIRLPAAVVALEPLGYLDIVALECAARTIFTDSGGVQREAYFAAVPCFTLREATEWTNTVEARWNRLVGSDTAAIRAALHAAPMRPAEHPPLFGEGDAAERIVAALESPATQRIIEEAATTRRARGR
ncbi:MAG: UDP-N-acetylglucosamine 2-epimerase (non-hydrolyzing) [Candidatus Eremiobacteraeota bacterium]|nr:UDP-N-acetylglucosamine 2-epimerase (non-hydrolyzing) [Candidatus Eremiobacteraeota bacterium]MBC5802390.1 UDP-N-acetylglucosamine 2-epimerase (non-hydrolyzing) [Candidatus Eremiobacteraeota bacterium]MBC5820608.1 UDP-N-acetylglucosamine 2-epimerase (non-hydrolyzing) [Candidatus Eremiobacteraeota bacterium]